MLSFVFLKNGGDGNGNRCNVCYKPRFCMAEFIISQFSLLSGYDNVEIINVLYSDNIFNASDLFLE